MHRTWRYRAAILVFIAPALIIFTVVVTYPIVRTFAMSFFRWDGINVPTFIGIKNFLKLFTNPNFYIALKNGLCYSGVLVVYQIGLGTILALMMVDGKLKGRQFFKTAYFLPVVLSVTVVCQLWVTIYSYDYGLINTFLKALGLSFRQSWLVDSKSAIFAIAFADAWQFMGIEFLFLYSAALTIPKELLEAARLEGASSGRVHRHISLPLMAEAYKFCSILAVTGGLRAFGTMYIMTSGGPGTSTYTLTYLMYRLAFLSGEYGYATSSSVVLIAECLLATILLNRFIARERYTF